ncbi:MAG: hypothetical protein CMN78_05520 [Spirochaetales bacterium]|nr:hypothetical protein [Spirochaetales bacterium]
MTKEYIAELIKAEVHQARTVVSYLRSSGELKKIAKSGFSSISGTWDDETSDSFTITAKKTITLNKDFVVNYDREEKFLTLLSQKEYLGNKIMTKKGSTYRFNKKPHGGKGDVFSNPMKRYLFEKVTERNLYALPGGTVIGYLRTKFAVRRSVRNQNEKFIKDQETFINWLVDQLATELGHSH